MSELTFTKQYLSTLDSKPVKLPADHVFDPKTFAPRVPTTLPRLPHLSHPTMPKKSIFAPIPGSEPQTVTITLKSARNPPLSLSLSEITPTQTTIQDLKHSVLKELGGPDGGTSLDRIKILYKRKPITDASRTLTEVLDGQGEEGKEVEFGVMVLGYSGGGATTPSATATDKDPVDQQAAAAVAILESQPAPAVPAAGGEPMEGVEKVPLPPSPAPEPAAAAQGESVEEVLKTDAFWEDLKAFLMQRLKDEAEAKRVGELFKRALDKEKSRSSGSGWRVWK